MNKLFGYIQLQESLCSFFSPFVTYWPYPMHMMMMTMTMIINAIMYHQHWKLQYMQHQMTTMTKSKVKSLPGLPYLRHQMIIVAVYASDDGDRHDDDQYVALCKVRSLAELPYLRHLMMISHICSIQTPSDRIASSPHLIK